MKTFSLDLLAPCNEPAAPSFGEKLGKDFRHGHSVTFFCRQGYQIVGAVSITCNDGTWDVQVPVCKGQLTSGTIGFAFHAFFKQTKNICYYLLYFTGVCERPRTPGNVNLHGNSFLDGDLVTFTCAKNHDLVGNATLRCVGQAWDSSVPKCKGEFLVKKMFTKMLFFL